MSDVCKFYMQGSCRYGDSCRFAHESSSMLQQKALHKYTHESFSCHLDGHIHPKPPTAKSVNEVVSNTVSAEVFEEVFKKCCLLEKEVINLTKKIEEQEKHVKDECSVKTLYEDENINCSICLEVLIKPTLLNCSHVFCEWCINRSLKFNATCPVCRKVATNKTYCRDFDKFIKKIVDFGPAEVKDLMTSLSERRAKDEPLSRQQEEDMGRLLRVYLATNMPNYVTL